jgi:hypothetical protein
MTQTLLAGAEASRYRGSTKHKDRPLNERKGTLCPEWTHATAGGGFAADPFSHRWAETAAHRLFESATLSADGRRRFATERGIAFEAKPSADGTWHGFPIPWESVPPAILKQWKQDGKVSRQDMKLYKPRGNGDLRWSLESDAS